MDAANRERLPEAHSELVKLLSEKELKDASLLILANKQVSLSFLFRNWQICGSGSGIDVGRLDPEPEGQKRPTKIQKS
jgi:hypothetical protein